ncbi:unnamed protein product [Lota lota]
MTRKLEQILNNAENRRNNADPRLQSDLAPRPLGHPCGYDMWLTWGREKATVTSKQIRIKNKKEDVGMRRHPK